MIHNRFMLIAALSILLASCQKEIDRQNSSVSSSVLESNEKIGNEGMVYTLSNQVSENKVLAYSRDASGHLTFLKAYSTGEKGTGAGLGSQEAVILSRNNEWLLAVNAGSNSVSSFKISRNNLQLISTVSSQGTTPISVTEHNNIVYVLNAGGSGNISGFTLDQSGNLKPIANSVRPLSSTSASPAQISFTTNGKAAVVTEKQPTKSSLILSIAMEYRASCIAFLHQLLYPLDLLLRIIVIYMFHKLQVRLMPVRFPRIM